MLNHRLHRICEVWLNIMYISLLFLLCVCLYGKETPKVVSVNSCVLFILIRYVSNSQTFGLAGILVVDMVSC